MRRNVPGAIGTDVPVADLRRRNRRQRTTTQPLDHIHPSRFSIAGQRRPNAGSQNATDPVAVFGNKQGVFDE